MERDWKTPGDGLLTFDDVNNREWLDLSQTIRINFPSFQLNDIAMELEPGGMFEGFQWANIEDVTAFAQSAGIDTSVHDFDINGESAASLIQLIEPTALNSFSVGYLDDVIMTPQGDGFATAIFSQGANAGLLVAAGGGDIGRPSTSGLMIFRTPIPEPNSMALAAVSLTCLFIRFVVKRQEASD